MAWINRPGRITSLTINGIQHISNLLNFTVSDESFNQNGIITTTGQIELANLPADYERDNFVRGHTVLVDVSVDGGTPVRHPRGYLFVLSSSYSAENETHIVEVGCQLALKELVRDIQDLVSYIPSKYTTGTPPAISADVLEELEDTSLIRQALAQDGLAIYADNTNTIQQISVFGNVDTSNFVSIKGVTTESVQPLVSEPIPDAIDIAFNYPTSTVEITDDVITDTEINTYPVFVNIPNLERQRPENLADSNPRPSEPRVVRTITGCGGSLGDVDDPPPLYEAGDDGESCSGGFITVETESSFTVTTSNTVITEYRGYAKQQSKQIIIRQASGYEINSGYYDDYLSFCIDSFASACNPSGSCVLPASASNAYVESQEVTQFEYSNVDGGLVKTTTDRYLNRFSALKPVDWRAGLAPDGSFTEFRTQTPDGTLFLATRSVVTTRPYGNGTETIEELWESPLVTSSTGARVSVIGRISAIVTPYYKKTTRRTLSFSSASRPATPNIVATDTTTEQVEDTFTQAVWSKNVINLQPYTIDASLNINAKTESAARSWVATYGQYLARLVQGESRGLTIVEGLRADHITNWRPGFGMRYSDGDSSTVLAGIMDAATWSADTTTSGVGWRFLVYGISNGSISAPSNTVGDQSTPVTPGISNETRIDQGAVITYAAKRLYLRRQFTPGAEDVTDLGIVAVIEPFVARRSISAIRYATSYIVEPGALLDVPGSGTVPVSYGGIILTDAAVFVDIDLFQ